MQKLKIERKFNTSMITVEITDEEVGVSVPFEDYMNMLLDGMGQVATLMTKAQLKAKLVEASERLNLEMKSHVRPFAQSVKR